MSNAITLNQVQHCFPIIDDYVPLQSPISRSNEMKKLYKKNKRFIKRIDKVMRIIESIKVCNSKEDFSTLENRVLEDNSRNSQELNPDNFLIQLPHKNKISCESKIIPKESEENLIAQLEKSKGDVLHQILIWNPFTSTYRTFIKTLQNYKDLVSQLIKLWEKRDKPYEKFLEDLKTLRSNTESEKLKVPSYYSYYWKGHKDHPEISIHKDYLASLGGKESPWLQFEYFSEIPESVIKDLKKLNNRFEPSGNVEFISLYGINRLLAIAKMMYYCDKTKIKLSEFQEGRTKQRISALESRYKALIEEQSIFNDRMQIPEDYKNVEFYPTPIRFSYFIIK